MSHEPKPITLLPDKEALDPSSHLSSTKNRLKQACSLQHVRCLLARSGSMRIFALWGPVMLCALCRHLHMLLDISLEAPGLARMKMETRAVDDPVTGPCLLATRRGTTFVSMSREE